MDRLNIAVVGLGPMGQVHVRNAARLPNVHLRAVASRRPDVAEEFATRYNAEIQAAVVASRAVKIYVCNIATQAGETDLYTCHDNVRELEEHAGDGLFDVVLCNSRHEGDLRTGQWVSVDERSRGDHRLYRADLIDPEVP